jgi:Tol biopolymer transport system component
MIEQRRGTALALLLWTTVGMLAGGRAAWAVCNLIPGTTQTFRATLGSINRPFAGPGDSVELRVSPLCDAASAGFVAPASELVVSVVFTPPSPAASTVVVLTHDCERIETALSACGEPPAVRCLETDPSGLEVTEPDGQRRLRFGFPDTRGFVPAANDPAGRLTLAGSAAIAVSTVRDPLPCDLGRQSCAQQNDLLACVDRLFAVDGSCGTTPHETFTHFTALPLPNDYQALCTEPAVPNGPCTGRADQIQFAVDAEGNILLPMDWRGVLVPGTVPVARLLRGSTMVAAGPAEGPIQVPSSAFLASYTPDGGKLPPIFAPQRSEHETDALTLFGTADAPHSVLRVARRSPTGRACAVPGQDAGQPCTKDGDCRGSDCVPAPALFDFSDRLQGGVGPVVIPRYGAGVCQDTGNPCGSDVACGESRCVSYRIEAKDPAPLDGLAATDDLLTLVVSEAIDDKDLNGDGDTIDDVALLLDGSTGVARATGEHTSLGRAATRIRQPPFTFAAVAVEDNVVAYLEPEPQQGDCQAPANCDHNGDGDAFDTVLRIFRFENGTPQPVIDVDIAVDAEPLVNARSVAVSNGRVFFRTPEWMAAAQRTAQVTVTSSGEPANGFSTLQGISADGHAVAFQSNAGNLTDEDTGFDIRAFLRDWTANQSTRLPDASTVISGDGRLAGFSENSEAFVYDLESELTTQVSVDWQGNDGNGSSRVAAISADGRFVALESDAGNLVPCDANGTTDVFVHDLETGKTTGASVNAAGCQANSSSFGAAISGDGRFVAFLSYATDLVLPDDALGIGVFVHDRMTGATTRANIDSQGRSHPVEPQPSAISADGRFVAFASSSDLVPGDTNLRPDIYVRDRVARQTARVSVDSVGRSQFGDSIQPSLSAAGRFVAFLSSDRLVPNDINGHEDVYLHDLLTGHVVPISVTPGGRTSGKPSARAAVSADGRFVAFESSATDVVPGALGLRDVFVRGPDLSDCPDLTGDCDWDDTLLQVVDTTPGEDDSHHPLPLCQAQQVQVANGIAAFLRPEAAGEAVGCPPGPSFNGDADATDHVVHLWRPSDGVSNLHCAASAIALSDDWLAALVPEADQGGAILNNDGDSTDTVVKIWRLADPLPQDCGDWLEVEAAADAIGIAGSQIVFLTPEAAQGENLNGDRDLDDRVLQFYDPASGSLTSQGLAAEEFVTGRNLIAFRTSEAAQGGRDLNGDGDAADAVLHIYDRVNARLIPSGQAAIPCFLEACDPRVPYRVLDDTVKFLTLEVDQDADLTGDGDRADLVLQTINVPLAATGMEGVAAGADTPPPLMRTQVRDGAVFAGPLTTLGAVSAGVCTDTGTACASDDNCCRETDDCANRRCFVPPGGCIQDLAVPCNPQVPNSCCPAGTGQPCAQFCQPVADPPGGGTCRILRGACQSNSDCRAQAACTNPDRCQCNDVGQKVHRLIAPFAAGGAAASLFVSSGRCIENLQTPCRELRQCPAGQFCGDAGSCQREHGTCRTDADCTIGACRADLVLASAADSDADEIPDPFDNCAQAKNVDQQDEDGDGVGNACDAMLTRPPCAGDCDASGAVRINELVTGIGIALGTSSASHCAAFDRDHSGTVTIDELVAAVDHALSGCPLPPASTALVLGETP